MWHFISASSECPEHVRDQLRRVCLRLELYRVCADAACRCMSSAALTVSPMLTVASPSETVCDQAAMTVLQLQSTQCCMLLLTNLPASFEAGSGGGGGACCTGCCGARRSGSVRLAPAGSRGRLKNLNMCGPLIWPRVLCHFSSCGTRS